MRADDEKKAKTRLASKLIVLVAILAVAIVATYAWFTSNSRVNTNEVSVQSDSDALSFQMSATGDGGWSGSEEYALTSADASVDAGGTKRLYPVSTFDLDGFARCTLTNGNGQATVFEQAPDGEDFYHGWVYLRADLTGNAASTMGGVVRLYLRDAPVPSGSDQTLLRASRIGIKFSRGGSVEKTLIFRLDDSASAHRAEHPMTAPIDLPSYRDGMVLGWSGGQLACASDPSTTYDDYEIGSGEDASRPSNELLAMELGQTYRMDVYFYIEGTDPDSADYLDDSPGTLSLNLFAALDGRGA